MINRTLVLLSGLLFSSVISAGHHEEAKTLAPVASAGQVVVVYELPCENVEAGLATLKGLIAYEVGASPIAYSSSPGIIGDAMLGAVDLHESISSMESALAWQESDAKWKAMQSKSMEACGVNVEDITATTILAK